jgi:hypothetical protein
MITLVAAAVALLALATPVESAPGGGEAKPPASAQDTAIQPGYRIDRPGTITFTVGVVIKGKVDKPQVMIFLPKEKPYFRDFKLSHSFAEELKEPLPFEPFLE